MEKMYYVLIDGCVFNSSNNYTDAYQKFNLAHGQFATKGQTVMLKDDSGQVLSETKKTW